MTIICKVPANHYEKRQYIFDVVLKQWLGLDFIIKEYDGSTVCLGKTGSKKKIYLPDTFFSSLKENWLAPNSLPKIPLKLWDSKKFSKDIPLVDSLIPIIYGQTLFNMPSSEGNIILPIDIFGSAFFMLTRYEELVPSSRDHHDRFLSNNSIARKGNFLHRPIIDEYVEILWVALKKLWPKLERKSHEFRMILSHDVDRPGRYFFSNPQTLLIRIISDIIKRRYGLATLSAIFTIFKKNKIPSKDPYNTFDWIMDQSDKYGISSEFYFLCGNTHLKYDADYDIGDPSIRKLLKRIHARGHGIGLHPSYNSYQSPDLILNEANRLKQVCEEEEITQSSWGGRMHYLRWDESKTLKAWEQAKMDYESTLTFPDYAGFRCGSCREFTGFDLVELKALNINIRPLIAMDVSIMHKSYMDLGEGQKAFEAFRQLKNSCSVVKGNFTLLWHNSELDTDTKKDLYCKVLDTN